MDDDDFLALIEVLGAELRGIGAADIADERHYLQPHDEAGEARLIEPQKRLIEMLQAFGRLLAVEDRTTYVSALGRINDALRGDGPSGAFVELVGETRRTANVVDLAHAPDLSMVRKDTQLLIGRLAESRRPPERLA